MRRTGIMLGRVFAAAVTLLVYSAPARADDIKVTTGSFGVSKEDFAGLNFGNSSGFELAGELGLILDRYTPPYPCISCVGQKVNLSMRDSLTREADSPFTPEVTGSFSVDGLRYDIDAYDYKIMAGNVVVPLNATISTPFHLVATLRGTTAQGISQTFQLQGKGTASADFGNAGTGWISTEYKFQSVDAVQTPEPATLLLMVTGLSGLVAARTRARRKQ